MSLLVEKGDGTRGGGAMGGSSIARVLPLCRCLPPSTPAHLLARGARVAKFSGREPVRSPKIAFTSRRTAICMRWGGPIRKNIIGHRMSVLREHFRGGRDFLQVQGALALLDEPAREQRLRVFLDPLFQKRRNLLAEIGGMTKTREFVTLQRSARCREKELPGGLRVGQGHLGLLRVAGYVNSGLLTVNSTDR